MKVIQPDLRTDVQVFTVGMSTWTKPIEAQSVQVILIAAGGGGGSGRRGAAGTFRAGGSGGGGGGWNELTFAAGLLPSTVTVTVGAGGAGAAGITTDITNGVAGQDGGDTTFGLLIHTQGGYGGPPGDSFAPTTDVYLAAPSLVDAEGPRNTRDITTTYLGSPGGGAGGGIGGTGADTGTVPSGYTNNVAYPGGSGHNPNLVNRFIVSGGAGGGAGVNTPTGTYWPGSSGGGGNPAGLSGSATGGAGGNYGAGGGGGAASTNGTVSGAGGKGGDGVAVVISYF